MITVFPWCYHISRKITLFHLSYGAFRTPLSQSITFYYNKVNQILFRKKINQIEEKNKLKRNIFNVKNKSKLKKACWFCGMPTSAGVWQPLSVLFVICNLKMRRWRRHESVYFLFLLFSLRPVLWRCSTIILIYMDGPDIKIIIHIYDPPRKDVLSVGWVTTKRKFC